MDRLLPILLLLSFAANAGEAPDVAAKFAGSGIEIDSTISLPIKPCEAYAMLTDYNRLPSFVPGLLHSKSQRLMGGKVRVMQEGEVQIFVFMVHMKSLLEMEEVPDRRIVFRQVDGDFVSYEGSWDFSANADGTLLEYKAVMSFKPYVPRFLAKSVLQHDVKRKFTAIGREAAARKAEGTLHCGKPGQ